MDLFLQQQIKIKKKKTANDKSPWYVIHQYLTRYSSSFDVIVHVYFYKRKRMVTYNKKLYYRISLLYSILLFFRNFYLLFEVLEIICNKYCNLIYELNGRYKKTDSIMLLPQNYRISLLRAFQTSNNQIYFHFSTSTNLTFHKLLQRKHKNFSQTYQMQYKV